MAEPTSAVTRATPRKSALDIAHSAAQVQMCDGYEERQKSRGLARPGYEGTTMPEFQDWYKELITTNSRSKRKNASALHMGCCVYKCDVFLEFGVCRLMQHVETGDVVGECGRVHTQVCQEGAEKRFFQDDYEASLANVRAEEDRDAAGKELVSIEGCDIGRPELDDASMAAGDVDEEDEAGWDVVRKANQRLNQCTVWFNCMRERVHGCFYLTPDEELSARRALRAVCVRWARLGCDVANASSPVFWAIGIALEMVARRPDGYTVPTPYMQSIVTPEGLWHYLEPRKSDAFWTDESDFNKTRAWVRTRDQMSMRDAVRAAQARKMACLSQLLGQSGFFKGSERTTLHPSLLSLHPPTVRAVPPEKASDESLHEVWAVGRARFGLDALRKAPAAGQVSTSATASDTSSDMGDDEAESESDDDDDEPMSEAGAGAEPMAVDPPEAASVPAGSEPAATTSTAEEPEAGGESEEEEDNFDSGDEVEAAVVRTLDAVSDDTDSDGEDSRPAWLRAFPSSAAVDDEPPELEFERKRRNYSRAEWGKLSQKQALASANFDRNPKWIKEWREAVRLREAQEANVDAERQAKLDRRRERKLRRQRRAIEARLIDQARREDAPLIAKERAAVRARHNEELAALRAERRQRREQEASQNRAERRVEAASSSNALALSIAKSEDMPDEATGHIPKLKLQVARKGSGGTVTHTNATFDEAAAAYHRAKVGNRVADKLLPGARGLGTVGDKKHWGGQSNLRVGLKLKGMHAYSLQLRGDHCIAKRRLLSWV